MLATKFAVEAVVKLLVEAIVKLHIPLNISLKFPCSLDHATSKRWTACVHVLILSLDQGAGNDPEALG